MMNVGLIGLGKMGNAIAQRLVQAGHTVIGYDKDRDAQEHAVGVGVECVDHLQKMAAQTQTYWLMLPAGETIDAVIKELMPFLKVGDVVVDGSNSKWTDSIRRAEMLSAFDIKFLDCGTSGGLQGRANGFCLMVGGSGDTYTKVHELFAAIATPGGVSHLGPSGAGHYAKMVHNAIEYAIMEAYGEGFQLLKESNYGKECPFDLEEVSRLWTNGSIIRSWILDLSHTVLQHDQKLENISGELDETGMGRWAYENARDSHVVLPLIEKVLQVREQSRKDGGTYATKLGAMLRHLFGGHPVKKIDE